MTNDIHDLTEQIARCHDPEAKRLLGQALLERLAHIGEQDDVTFIDSTTVMLAVFGLLVALAVLGFVMASVL